jgi:hypothetical protein
MGPMVWELDGPTPILKRSRTLMNIKLPVIVKIQILLSTTVFRRIFCGDIAYAEN